MAFRERTLHSSEANAGRKQSMSNSPLSQALLQADREYRRSRYEADRDETTRPVAMSVILQFAQQNEATERVRLYAPGPVGLQVDDEIEIPRPGEGRR